MGALRRCTKGPPLLPAIDADGTEDNIIEPDSASGFRVTWVEVGQRHICLVDFLSAFQMRLPGFRVEDAVAVYDSLDSRRLAQYQAVLTRTGWGKLWAVLESPFKEMRAVYRHRFGGTTAPEITVDVTPRFVNLGSPHCRRGAEGIDTIREEEVPVYRTF